MRGRAQPAFSLYLPPKRRWHHKLPLLVMLHGCKQDAKDFAAGTGMNHIAEREHFAVLYPEQDGSVNPMRCWNWFHHDVMRGEGESQALVALIQRVRDRYRLNPQRVYVAGMSAGAAMAQVLAVRHPEIFAAAALHSGLMYHAAATPWHALSTMRRGSRLSPATLAREVRAELGVMPWVPTLLIHGQADDAIAPRNAIQAAEQICTLAEDVPGSRRVELTESSMIAGGRRCELQEWRRDGRLLVRLCLVDQLGHAWSGGDAKLPFNDAAGPDASQMIWDFVAPFRRIDAPGVATHVVPRVASSAA